jgi:hypothetical protein
MEQPVDAGPGIDAVPCFRCRRPFRNRRLGSAIEAFDRFELRKSRPDAPGFRRRFIEPSDRPLQ